LRYNGSIAQELDEMKQYKVQDIGGESSEYDKDNSELFIPVPGVDQSMLIENPYVLENYQLFYDQDMWKRYKDELDGLGYTMLDHHWLILDNVTFSVEICLDHLPPSAVALKTFEVNNFNGSPLRIPKNVEHWDPAANKHFGGVEYVKLPSHGAQLSLVSSMGMESDPGGLCLADGGTLILQDGEHDGFGSTYTDLGCDGFFKTNFKGGSESITRTTTFGATTYTYYRFKVNTPDQSALVYENDDDFAKAAEGVFTTTTFRPRIHAYPPSDIADVYPTEE
jgi:hypothetical protein